MPNSQAELSKEHGNACFARGKLDAAIEAYTEAICTDSAQPTYHTNRAMCFRRKEAWPAVISDCDAALALDPVSIKAHYLRGVALDAQSIFAEAVHHLHRALELCKERTVSYKEDIQRAMLAARRHEWEAGRAASEAQVAMTESVAEHGLREHYAREAAAEAGAGGAALAEQEAASVQACVAEAMDGLRMRRGPAAVPDYYCCKITMDPMLAPVTTPDGVSYERHALREHLAKVGAFDPVTRRALDFAQVVPNLALKEAIQSFLTAHPWAYESEL